MNELAGFYESYKRINPEADRYFATLLKIVEEQKVRPYQFEPYHEAIRAPFDYYKFGLNLFKALIDFPRSTLHGKEHLQSIHEAVQRGENVVLLANHQIEPDPQVISAFLEKEYPELAEKMIFVAGHRVITDPVAIPMSMGRNLLCIFSKKYIDVPPEKKAEKLSHNARTMKAMEERLRKGGACIYVAPSGGRDRMNDAGVVEVAPFDPDSIELFYLIAKKAGTKTHFHTLALSTYDLMPPPKGVQIEIGEARDVNFAPAHLTFGPEVNMEEFQAENKHEKRRLRAEAITNKVIQDYQQFPKL